MNWPVDNLPKDLQRPELDYVKAHGIYNWENPFDVVNAFEERVAEFAGANFGVAVDSCTSGIRLCLEYLKLTDPFIQSVSPKHINVGVVKNTYVSIPMQVIQAGFKLQWYESPWSGVYELRGTPIWDAATRWKANMYISNSLYVISFQMKKRIPIGKGGMILTDDWKAASTLKRMSYDGRESLVIPWPENKFQIMGHHVYMTPEDAARGLILLEYINEKEYPDTADYKSYPDVSKFPCFKKWS